MTENLYALLYYALPFAAIYAMYMHKYRRKQELNVSTLREAEEAGLTSPASLHPIIDKSLCIGCEACVHACPEFPAHTVLGVIKGKATLTSPTDCIGHGACQAACPVGAISLVFGTSERGVDIPDLSPDFESSVPGIYIAGELGGMGLIRNAVEQGRQAMDNLADNLAGDRSNADYDVGIVGAGPAGLAATLNAHERGLKYVTIEQDALGGTVANFPRGKLVMTAPVKLPLYGEMPFKETQKEELISFWQEVEASTGINVRYQEKLLAIETSAKGFTLVTDKGNYGVARVLLALGRRGSPRTLDVPGEDLGKVAYRMTDPSLYAGQQVCIVGGGDSALEAAAEIAEQPGSTVHLSYRSDAFSRAKRKNRDRVAALAEAGRLQVLLKSRVKTITPAEVVLEIEGGITTLPNDAVIVCAGGILPTGFLRDCGIEVSTKYGAA